ncbi:MAG: 3-dehydroquinate synthase [Candidatus Acidiferrum sp.]
MKFTETRPIHVRSSSGDYDVVCESGLLGRVGAQVRRLASFSSIHVVTSPKVWRALGKKVLGGFAKGARPHVHFLNDAESAKSMATVELTARSLVRARADRHSLIIAVGGGVVGDVAGFLAASYLRGVALVQVPTTLVAQVDSSVGGKTGVNLPEGKNLVGAFYPARLVLVDPEALKTLPEREYRGGLAEVIKYGVIADAELFLFLEREIGKLLKRDHVALLHIIRRSIEIKAKVVSEDERESGLREILNFGHTFGHALESATKYKKYQHGEAVALGMMCAGLLGHEIAGMPPDDVARMVSLLRGIGPLPGWPRIPVKRLLEAMRRDKKTRSNQLRFVLARKIGRVASYDHVEEERVLSVLRFMGRSWQKAEMAIGKRYD